MKINRLFEIIYLLIEKESITAKELAEKCGVGLIDREYLKKLYE